MEDKVNRLERELHGILAKKYAIVQEAKREARKQVLRACVCAHCCACVYVYVYVCVRVRVRVRVRVYLHQEY